MIKEPLMHMTSASSRFEQRERLHLREGEADLAGEKRRAALLVQGSYVSMKGAGGGGGAPGQTMSASRVSPLSSLPHLLYGKQCDSFKLFPFKVGAMPSFPSTRCWKDAPEGRGFLESSAGTRTPAGAHPASGPGGLPCATLQPRPATHLSAAPTRGNRSARTAGTRACPAPPTAPSSPHTGRGVCRGVHREPLHLPPTRPASSEGLVLTGAHAPSAHPHLLAPVVDWVLPAGTPECRLLFAPRHQTSSSLTQPANSSGIRWPNHNFASGV